MVACPRVAAHGDGRAHSQSTQSLLPIAAPVLSPDPGPARTPEASLVDSPVADAMLGQRLGDYVVRHRLGSGGMGVVYAGEHVTLGSKAAIKLILEEHAKGPHARDLLNEARAASAIRHHGIIDVFGFGQQSGVGQYLVMEYLEGCPLNELIRQRAPLAPSVALPLLCEVLDALSAAHAVGVIHRDLKPSNIFVVRQSNGTEYIKVLDFGLAKRSSAPDGTTPQTRSDLVIGTPQYMSPEQALCEAVSPQTDLYAVGVIAFELLTGQRPFTGRSHMEVVAHHIRSAPPAPSSLVPQAPELDALVLRLLAKEPRQRPASASQVAAELRVLLRNPSPRTSSSSLLGMNPAEVVSPQDRTATLSPVPESPHRLARTPSPRSPWRWAALAGGGLAIASGLGLILHSRVPELPPREVTASRSVPEASTPSSSLEDKPLAESPPAPVSAAPASTSVPVETPRPRPVAATGTRKAAARSSAPSVVPLEIARAPVVAPMPPPPEPAATGLLHLSVKGAWADVVVDGQRLGRVPPQNKYPLTAGEHELELRNPNLAVYRQRILIPPHGVLPHGVDFSAETRSTTAPSP
jgi:serine/threonine protein kinase